MSQSSYGPLFEALAHYNDKLLAMARAQTERTAQALLQTSLWARCWSRAASSPGS